MKINETITEKFICSSPYFIKNMSDHWNPFESDIRPVVFSRRREDRRNLLRVDIKEIYDGYRLEHVHIFLHYKKPSTKREEREIDQIRTQIQSYIQDRFLRD